MKKVILHVGPHKTGSTAMQGSLFRAARTLSRAGLCYPRTGIRGIAHHEIVDWARGHRRHRFDPEAFAHEIEHSDRILISSENVIHLNAGQLKKMVDLFGPADVTVVYYLRRLADLWPSHWQEVVKHGQVLSFREYLAETLMELSGAETLVRVDQSRQIALLNGVFGRSAVRILGYDRMRDSDEDLAADLLARFCSPLDLPELPAGKEVNRSKAAWQITLIRLFNILWVETYGTKPGPSLRIQLLRALGEHRLDWIETFIEQESTWSVPLEMGNMDTAIFALQNRMIDQYRDQIADDCDATIAAYMSNRGRTVLDAVFPIEIPAALLAHLRQTLEELAARIKA